MAAECGPRRGNPHDVASMTSDNWRSFPPGVLKVANNVDEAGNNERWVEALLLEFRTARARIVAKLESLSCAPFVISRGRGCIQMETLFLRWPRASVGERRHVRQVAQAQRGHHVGGLGYGYRCSPQAGSRGR